MLGVLFGLSALLAAHPGLAAYPSWPPGAILVSCDSSTNPYTYCGQQFGNAYRKVFGQGSAEERDDTAGSALNKCLRCATDVLHHEMDQFAIPSDPNGAQR